MINLQSDDQAICSKQVLCFSKHFEYHTTESRECQVLQPKNFAAISTSGWGIKSRLGIQHAHGAIRGVDTLETIPVLEVTLAARMRGSFVLRLGKRRRLK
jgi:hypothetical protein